MSFQTGLSGLNASSRSLDVIGNNIANANTVGMKSSRTEFGDIIASSLGASSGGAGIGVAVAAVAQQFTQGNITTTGNNLDVAINGGGFFQLVQPDGSFAYTRDGEFKLDKDGYIKTNTGAYLRGTPIDPQGNKGAIDKLQMPTGKQSSASPTTKITAEFNLDARVLDNTALAAAGKATNPRSTFGTTLNAYDAQGVASPINLFFEKDPAPAVNSWSVYTGLVDKPNVGDNTVPWGNITFDSTGKVSAFTPGAATPATTATATGTGIVFDVGTFDSTNPNEASVPPKIQQQITLDLSTVTQYGTAFSVSNLTQDGYTAGQLTGLNIGEDGTITARYSNGQTQSAGQLALFEFRNVQGLVPLGGNAWQQTFASGEPVQGVPSVGNFGALRSGALEESNVDLTSELVNMMTAQRTYQANAQTIKTQDQIMSTLVNLR